MFLLSGDAEARKSVFVNLIKAWREMIIPFIWSGGDKLAKCPLCGIDVANPIKEWDLSPKVHVKLYEHCGKKFREYITKK